MERMMDQAKKFKKLLVLVSLVGAAAQAQGSQYEAMQQGPLYGRDGFYLGCVVASQEGDESSQSFELDDTISELNCVERSRH
jgi:hypothetical protein